MARVSGRAPGRVNLIGDHTDYTGGLVLPMAVDRWTTVEGEAIPGRVELRSDGIHGRVRFDLPVSDPASVEPAWGRYVAGVAAELGARVGVRGWVRSDVPVGSGLSSSAALEVATAMALGYDGDPVELAHRCRAAEHRATGVPCGIMDQLTSAAAVAGHALLIDCDTLAMTPVAIPPDVHVLVRFVEHRRLESSGYAARVEQCEAAARQIGPLGAASLADVAAIADPVVRRRARHVVSENERVRGLARALVDDDEQQLADLLAASHASLRDDFEVSTAGLDAAVAELVATPGVIGARLTGGGFGGCVVALVRPGAEVAGWLVQAVDGALVRRPGSSG